MSKRILIVDDAAFMRMMIKDILSKNGFEVVGEAADGLQAVEKYAELKPDLVTMDITMPEGTGWTYPPFEGVVADDRVYGRGAIDDKGPTIAAWMAMKLVKEAGIELSKRVRLIIGSDEESGFRCVTRYFEKEEMPDLGFAPDADFPIINAEKGIANLKSVLQNGKVVLGLWFAFFDTYIYVIAPYIWTFRVAEPLLAYIKLTISCGAFFALLFIDSKTPFYYIWCHFENRYRTETYRIRRPESGLVPCRRPRNLRRTAPKRRSGSRGAG